MGKRKPAQTAPVEVKNLTFSFQYYDTDKGNEFCLADWDKEDIRFTLARLKEICSKTIQEIMRGAGTYHFYETNWGKSPIFPNGFSARALNDLPPFHFSIVGLNHNKARVFGALSGLTFYIVWFDFEHEIIPSALKNT